MGENEEGMNADIETSSLEKSGVASGIENLNPNAGEGEDSVPKMVTNIEMDEWCDDPKTPSDTAAYFSVSGTFEDDAMQEIEDEISLMCSVGDYDHHQEGSNKKTPKAARAPVDCRETPENDALINRMTTLTCDLCHFQPKHYTDLKAHFRSEHKREVYVRCCGKYYSVYKTFILHINWHLEKNRYCCHICNKILSSSEARAAHLNRHDQKPNMNNWHCGDCQKVFPNKESVPADHALEHLKDNSKSPYQCEICDKRFLMSKYLKRHVRLIHERRPYDRANYFVCEACGKQFKSEEYFKDHLLEHRGFPLPRVQCDICLTWVRNRHHLSLHKRTHTKRDFLCNFCGRHFDNIITFNSHKVKHNPKKPQFTCSRCFQTFQTKQLLLEHLASHDGISLYKCPVCSKEWRQVNGIKKHVESKHIEEWLEMKATKSYECLKKPEFRKLEEDFKLGRQNMQAIYK